MARALAQGLRWGGLKWGVGSWREILGVVAQGLGEKLLSVSTNVTSRLEPDAWELNRDLSIINQPPARVFYQPHFTHLISNKDAQHIPLILCFTLSLSISRGK